MFWTSDPCFDFSSCLWSLSTLERVIRFKSGFIILAVLSRNLVIWLNKRWQFSGLIESNKKVNIHSRLRFLNIMTIFGHTAYYSFCAHTKPVLNFEWNVEENVFAKDKILFSSK